MCTLDGSRSAARWYASRASAVWLLQDSYYSPVSTKHFMIARTRKTYQSAEIIPNLGNIWVQANGSRVRIESIPILVDLVIQHTNTAPKCWIPAITVNGLLISLVCLRILLLRHIAASQEIPALCVGLIYNSQLGTS